MDALSSETLPLVAVSRTQLKDGVANKIELRFHGQTLSKAAAIRKNGVNMPLSEIEVYYPVGTELVWLPADGYPCYAPSPGSEN